MLMKCCLAEIQADCEGIILIFSSLGPQHWWAWGGMIICRDFISASKGSLGMSPHPPSLSDSRLVLRRVVMVTLFPSLVAWIQLLGGELVWTAPWLGMVATPRYFTHTHTLTLWDYVKSEQITKSSVKPGLQKALNSPLDSKFGSSSFEVMGLFENLMNPVNFFSRMGGTEIYSSSQGHHFRGCELSGVLRVWTLRGQCQHFLGTY